MGLVLPQHARVWRAVRVICPACMEKHDAMRLPSRRLLKHNTFVLNSPAHLCLKFVDAPAEQHKGIVLALHLGQAPALTHRQRSVWRVIAQATAFQRIQTHYTLGAAPCIRSNPLYFSSVAYRAWCGKH